MKIEHVAFNVKDPAGMAKWYGENLGMRIVREGPPPVSGRFLADSVSSTVLEVYHNPPEAVPDYASMDPLLFHIAFCADDVEATRDKLIAAGATPVGEVSRTESGDVIAMLRDPWGLAIQFVQRVKPMV